MTQDMALKGYTKRCLLKGHNPLYLIYIKGAYWMKMCLLTEKMPTKWKCAYWQNMYLLN